ncbi:MAG: hypothetical protein ACE5EX_05675, partial [Phycisphaerae bacterium]
MHRKHRVLLHSTPFRALVFLTAVTIGPAFAPAQPSAFDAYGLIRSVELPPGAGPFDVLADGRLITLVGDAVWLETSAGSAVLSETGTLPSADIGSSGAAFVRVSPDGLRFAAGNNGGVLFNNPQVGVFTLDSLAGTWFSLNHFDAAWMDDTRLAVTAGAFGSPGVVTVLDTTSPDPAQPLSTTVIGNIGGASGGVALDTSGFLYTGNGFSTLGPSGTGTVKAFPRASWEAALAGGPPLDFESTGTLIVDILSASPLGFDAEGNLFVGGGDVPPDADFVALVRGSAVAAALTGAGPVDPADPLLVRRLDPDPAGAAAFYSALFNAATGELYVRDFADTTVYVYDTELDVPTLSQ